MLFIIIIKAQISTTGFHNIILLFINLKMLLQ